MRLAELAQVSDDRTWMELLVDKIRRHVPSKFIRQTLISQPDLPDAWKPEIGIGSSGGISQRSRLSWHHGPPTPPEDSCRSAICRSVARRYPCRPCRSAGAIDVPAPQAA